MAAVVQRKTEYSSTSVGTVKTLSARSRRFVKSRRRNKFYVLIVSICLLALFAYGVLSAEAVKAYWSCQETQAQTLRVQHRVDQLSAELEAEQSPEKITQAATKFGMVNAQEYDYVGGIGRVASSSQ